MMLGKTERNGKADRRWLLKGFLVLAVILIGCLAATQTATRSLASTYPFQDYTLPLDTRVSDLMSRLTQAEKISLLHQWQPAISRLGIASFRTGTEGLHGIAWLGTATVFPQAIGLGSTWDMVLLDQVGSAIGDEARGFHAMDPTNVGLSIWAPVVDLQRDPRAGRFEEGYSEDPFLTGQLATAYSNGMTGGDSFYYKAIPTLKHFFAYNQEANRDTLNVTLDARNLNEYYLAAFRYPIASGAAKSMMTSYNKVNGVPNTVALQINDIVKVQWDATDFLVVSDAYAPTNLYQSQSYYSDYAHAAAGMIKAGNCSFTQDGSSASSTINAINSALNQGLITSADIDDCVAEILRVRFHTGEFDVPTNSANPYQNLGQEQIASVEHDAQALQAAHEAVILLKNTNDILPLSKSISSVAVIGPRADDNLTDWYSGTMPHSVTPRAGITGKGVTVHYALDNTNNAAVNAAASSSVAIVFLGNRPQCDGGWGGTCLPSEGKETIDRQSIDLESGDLSLLQAVYGANPNTIVVLVSSFPYSHTNWPDVPGVIYTAHGGQNAGTAIADVLFGDYAPAGRLTTTWYTSTNQIPAITSYDIISGRRTYMYFNGTPLYAFGHGLTYTTFTYNNLRLSANPIPANGEVTVSVDVTNSGSRTSDEVVQLYEHDQAASVTVPIKKLVGFQRLSFSPGQTKTVSFTLPASELAYWRTSTNSFYVEPGAFDIMVGPSSGNIKLTATLNVTAGGPTSTPIRTPTPTNVPINTATATSTGTCTNTLLQAEDASFGGGATADSNNAGFTGSGFINFPSSGGYVQFNDVDGGSGGTTIVQIRYALGASASRTGQLTVNGTVQNITFTPTGSWISWAVHEITVSLSAGATNTIRFESTGQDLANIDQIEVVSCGTIISTSTPTPTQGLTLIPTSTPTRTPTRTQTPALTNAPTNTPTLTPTTGGGATCSPVAATIAAPFTFDGAGIFCWQSSDLGSYVNAWNLSELTINGVDFTNKYIPVSSYPAPIDGYWYVSYTGSYPWSHFEVR